MKVWLINRYSISQTFPMKIPPIGDLINTKCPPHFRHSSSYITVNKTKSLHTLNTNFNLILHFINIYIYPHSRIFFFIDLLREWVEEGRRGGKGNIHVESHSDWLPPACSPLGRGIEPATKCSWLGIEPGPFGPQDETLFAEPTWPGHKAFSHIPSSRGGF